MRSEGSGTRDRGPGKPAGRVRRTKSPGARATAVFATLLLALASCRNSASDSVPAPETTAEVTVAPAVADPGETSDAPPSAPEPDATPPAPAVSKPEQGEPE